MADWTIVHQCQCYLAAKNVGSHRKLKWKELAWDSGISRGEFEVTIPKMITMNTKTIVENRTVYFQGTGGMSCIDGSLYEPLYLPTIEAAPKCELRVCRTRKLYRFHYLP
jgi:hypothetical protein